MDGTSLLTALDEALDQRLYRRAQSLVNVMLGGADEVIPWRLGRAACHLRQAEWEMGVSCRPGAALLLWAGLQAVLGRPLLPALAGAVHHTGGEEGLFWLDVMTREVFGHSEPPARAEVARFARAAAGAASQGPAAVWRLRDAIAGEWAQEC